MVVVGILGYLLRHPPVFILKIKYKRINVTVMGGVLCYWRLCLQLHLQCADAVSLILLAQSAEKRMEMDLVCDAFLLGNIRK